MMRRNSCLVRLFKKRNKIQAMLHGDCSSRYSTLVSSLKTSIGHDSTQVPHPMHLSRSTLETGIPTASPFPNHRPEVWCSVAAGPSCRP